MVHKMVEIREVDAIWYSDALEHTVSIRYHLHQLIVACESQNRFLAQIGTPTMPGNALEDAKKALQEAEEFFTGIKPAQVENSAEQGTEIIKKLEIAHPSISSDGRCILKVCTETDLVESFGGKCTFKQSHRGKNILCMENVSVEEVESGLSLLRASSEDRVDPKFAMVISMIMDPLERFKNGEVIDGEPISHYIILDDNVDLETEEGEDQIRYFSRQEAEFAVFDNEGGQKVIGVTSSGKRKVVHEL